MVRRTDDSNADGTPEAVAKYVYDGDRLTLELNGSDTLTHRHLWNAALDQVLADEKIGDQVIWPLEDHEGTARDLVSSSGAVLNHRKFDSYGRVTSETNDVVDCLFGYTGQILDEITGLQNHLERWYDPALGRWISEDPLGFAAGDANLSRYCGNSPTNRIDSSGLEWDDFGGMSLYDDWSMPLFDDGGSDWGSSSDWGSTDSSWASLDTSWGGLDSDWGSIDFSGRGNGPLAQPLDTSWGNLPSMALGTPEFSVPLSTSPSQQQSWWGSMWGNVKSAAIRADQFVGQLNAYAWTGQWVDPEVASGVDVAWQVTKGLGQGAENIGLGVAYMGKEMGLEAYDFGSGLIETVGNLAGMNWHFESQSSLGQASLQPDFSYATHVAETGANVLTVGVYDEAKTGYQLYNGQITVDQASQRFGAAGVMQLATAGMMRAPVETVSSNVQFTFRGDTRPPSQIFSEGFSPRGTCTDLLDYAENNSPSIFVGTSRSASVAEGFAGEGGYVYITRVNAGIDVNAALGKASPFPGEVEIVAPGGIGPQDIRGAWQVNDGKHTLYNSNPNFKK